MSQHSDADDSREVCQLFTHVPAPLPRVRPPHLRTTGGSGAHVHTEGAGGPGGPEPRHQEQV